MQSGPEIPAHRQGQYGPKKQVKYLYIRKIKSNLTGMTNRPKSMDLFDSVKPCVYIMQLNSLLSFFRY